jgi:DNA-binding MurR/RpiR family transcriptional regulator
MTGISERIRRVRNELAPAEVRVVEALLHDYPMAGLGSVGDLAATAGVSAPTVLRLVAKLGFGGYPEFREHLRGEVAARLFSPVEVYPRAGGSAGDLLATTERRYAEAVHATFRGLDPAETERAVAALCDLDARVLVAGGRFSGILATHLAAYLQILRPGVDDVPPEPGRRARALLSVDTATVLVAFDYRRHQPDTVEFGRQARARGARLVLLCDPFLSPLAPDADVLLTTSVAGPPPFDSAAGGLMVVEMLVGAVAERLGTSARQRLTDFELHANGADPSAVRAADPVAAPVAVPSDAVDRAPAGAGDHPPA